MLHTHHTTHHPLSFLAAVAAVGVMIGGMGAIMGKSGTPFVASVDAQREHRMQNIREKRIARMKQRSLSRARTHRSAPSPVTYPNTTLSLRDQNLGREYGVSLHNAVLSYPSLDITAPISRPDRSNWNTQNWIGLENQMQFALLHGVVAYPHSPSPGVSGNLVIAGHSSPPTIRTIGNPYSDIFANLPNANVGDQIEITHDGETHVYEVKESKVVPATHTSILKPVSDRTQLILFTCYPIGTTKDRFMVRAEIVQS